MFAGVAQVQQLWRGESLTVTAGNGKEAVIRLFPLPMQAELPIWLTVVNNPRTFKEAGAMGFGVLTNLMAQDIDRLAENLRIYRQALADHGHDPLHGHVTLLVHTFLGNDFRSTVETAKQPFKQYLSSSVGLFRTMARSQNLSVDFDLLTDDDKDAIFEHAYELYVTSTALIGTPDSCSPLVDKLQAVGVDEIACLVDFGVVSAAVLGSLPALTELKNRYDRRHDPRPCAAEGPAEALRAQDGVERSAPLTEAQAQLVLLSQLDPAGAVAYNEPVALELSGQLDLDGLRRAVQLLVERHEALRSRINIETSELVIPGRRTIEVPMTDLSGSSEDEKTNRLEQWFAAQAQSSFDLARGPLLKVEVLKWSDRRHYLCLSAHHIVVDGAAIGILLSELSALYNAELSGAAADLPDPLQISDYVQWLARSIASQEWQRQKHFWISRISESCPVLEFPSDRSRPPQKTYAGQRLTATLDGELFANIKRVGQRENCTLFMTLLAAYTVLLHRMADQYEIVVGIPALGRSMPGGDRLVAYCAHILPIHSDLQHSPRFAEHLRAIRSTLLDAYENQDFPFGNYLSELKIPREPSRAPVVDYIFNLDSGPPTPMMEGMTVAYYDQPVGSARFDLSISGVEIDNRLVLYCDYNTDLFEEATVRRLLEAFQTLLQAIVRAPDADVFELQLLSATERAQLLADFNAPSHPVPECRYPAIHHYFEAQVRRAPEAIAVVCPATGFSTRRTLTYSQLNERANQLAHYLRRRGLAREDLVAIYLDRTVEMVVAVLAVLKAGAAYLPLDPGYPSSRIEFICSDSTARFIVTTRSLSHELPDIETEFDLCRRLRRGNPSGTKAQSCGRRSGSGTGLCDVHVRLDGSPERSGDHPPQLNAPVYCDG